MVQNLTATAQVDAPIPLVLSLVFGAVMGIFAGGFTALATRLQGHEFVVPMGYLVTSRMMAEASTGGKPVPYIDRTLMVLVALLTMTGMLVVMVELLDAEARYQRLGNSESVAMPAASVLPFDPPVLLPLLVLLSAIMTAVV